VHIYPIFSAVTDIQQMIHAKINKGCVYCVPWYVNHAGKCRVNMLSVCNVGLMAKNEEIMKRAKSTEDAFQLHCDSKSHCGYKCELRLNLILMQ
jgi:hypothetical protein